ncbi:hypothetical protein [Vibrio furnissii]|uniref:hypothetical protein n=1 Tax=Vibrio furnissii TaxID=29494 RepID=UPI0020C1A8AB|nr:hypothetical protein [Vibrio furnissii]
MRFSLYINQEKAMQWGLNIQQAILFSYIHDLPTWGKSFVVSGEVYYWSGKDKIISELPILTDKPDTIKRHMAALEKLGLIERTVCQNRALVRVTEKGKQWNKSEEGREINPDQVGKNIPTSREKNPDQDGKKIPTKSGKKSRILDNQDPNTSISNKKINKKSSGLDFSSWPSEPSEQIFKDWKAMRDKKRAPITQTVINRLASKLVAAGKQFDMSVDDVLGLCVERGWQGFELEWLANVNRGKPQGVNYVGSDFTGPKGWEEFR